MMAGWIPQHATLRQARCRCHLRCGVVQAWPLRSTGGRHPGARIPVALAGKVYCKVDASFGAIELGDMLTTSATPGFAMKAQDPLRAFGSTIGKALSGLDAGCGLIPILVIMA